MRKNIGSNLPLVSVIIPAYNAEAFIKKTLDSVLLQSYKNIEVLVIDDGCQDRTIEIVESIAQIDKRVVLLQQQNAGVAAARNLGIEKSSGEYISPIDADDIWYSQKLEQQVQCMLQAKSSVGLVYAWSVYIDTNDLIIGKYNSRDFSDIYSLEGDVYTALVYRNFVGNSSVPLIRRGCFEKIGGYNSKLKQCNAQGCEDLDLYLRIAEYYEFKVVPEFLIGYRQIAGSMSDNSVSMARSYQLVMADVRKRHREIPSAVYQWSGSFFYSYLLGKSYSCGDYWRALIWLYKALQLDLLMLLRPGVYKTFLTCTLKLLTKLMASSAMENSCSKLQPKQDKMEERVLTVADIKQHINQARSLPWKPYDWVLLHRWFQVVQSCRSVSF